MFGVWVCLAFVNAACWGLTVVVNKRTLRLVDPIALNAILRVPTLFMAAFVLLYRSRYCTAGALPST